MTVYPVCSQADSCGRIDQELDHMIFFDFSMASCPRIT